MDREKMARRLLKLAKEILGGYRPYRTYSNDPRWIRAKYPGVAVDGTSFNKGDEVLYWPRTKKIMVGKQAKEAWREFESLAADEEFYQQQYGRY